MESRGEASGLEPAASAVLRAAREMAEGTLSAEGPAALEAHLDTAGITDLLVIIAFSAAVVRFRASARIEVEADYRRHLDRFPLPPD